MTPRNFSGYIKVTSISDSRQSKVLHAQAKNPHCLDVSWQKAAHPVTGYKIYCFPGNSPKAGIIKHINDVNQESAVISGLKPETMYKVVITSVSAGTESTMEISGDEIKMRKIH